MRQANAGAATNTRYEDHGSVAVRSPKVFIFPDESCNDPRPTWASEAHYGVFSADRRFIIAQIRTIFNSWFGRFARLQNVAAVVDLRGSFVLSRQVNLKRILGAVLHELFARIEFDINVYARRRLRPDSLPALQ